MGLFGCSNYCDFLELWFEAKNSKSPCAHVKEGVQKPDLGRIAFFGTTPEEGNLAALAISDHIEGINQVGDPLGLRPDLGWQEHR